MRNHPIVVLMLCICSLSTFSPVLGNTTNFDVTNKNITLDPLASLESELVGKVWHYQNQKLIFSETGIVSIFKPDEPIVKNRVWRIETTNGKTFLYLTNALCNEQIYRISKNGQAIIWVDEKTNHTVKVDSTPLEDKTAVLKTKKNLVGTWNSRIFPSDAIEDLKVKNDVSVMSADFRYVLKSDGSFSKTIYINEKKHSTENGLWQIAEDAKTLVLHFQKKDCSFDTKTAEIKLISMDELVLGKAFVTLDLEKKLCSENDSFFFSKQ